MSILKTIGSWLSAIFVGLLITVLLHQLAFQSIKVNGISMQPTLQNNERLFCLPLAPIHRGSVIVFDANHLDPQVSQKTEYVKRVIAVPGDTISNQNGQLLVNHRPVNEAYLPASQRNQGTGNWTLTSLSQTNQWLNHQGITKVPKGMYFVLGDHRSVSNDSRYWGLVPKQNILGVVKAPWWYQPRNHRQAVNHQWQHYFQKP